MKIERFRVQNYKNLKDVTVEGLSDINVFFGQNSVGKSNTFEALALALWLLNARAPKSVINLNSICQKLAIAAPLAPLDGYGPLSFQITIRWEDKDVSGQVADTKPNISTGTDDKSVPPYIRIEQNPNHDTVSFIDYSWEDEKEDSVSFSDDNLLPFVPPLHIIHAERRLGVERQGPSNGTTAVSHDNVKKTLFLRLSQFRSSAEAPLGGHSKNSRRSAV